MANIQQSVSRAFEVTKDIRIDYNIAEKGSSSLLTGVFAKGSTQAEKFYKSPDITNDESTKLAILYGREIMITPFLIDAGISSNPDNAAETLKTYRFVTGEGTSGEVVPGPNGSPLENVYIINKNKQPQPVIENSGKPSIGRVILAGAAGAAISSIPKIWDALFGDAKADPAKVSPTVDPVTGKVVPTPAEQAAIAVMPSLDELRNVNSNGKGENDILVWDPSQGQWVVMSINTLINTALESSEVCGGAGGTGGSGGSGGSGGTGGTGGSGGAVAPISVECLPTDGPVEYPCVTAPMTAPINGMVLLPTIVNTAANEYTQTLPATGSRGVEFHFFAGGNGKKAIWDETNPQVVCPVDSTNEYACFSDAASNPTPAAGGRKVEYISEASFKIHICVTANICGSQVLIYTNTLTETALSATSYTFMPLTLLWANTKLGPLLAKYPGQVFNRANPNVTVYIRRIDECDSEYPLYFEGYTRLTGNETTRLLDGRPAYRSQATNINAPKPIPLAKKADDGKFPLFRPHDGALGAPSCPEPGPIPVDPGGPGGPGTPGGGGNPGTPGAGGPCEPIDVAPPKAQPVLALANPCAKQYGTKTTPPEFDLVQLPAAFVSSGITDQNVVLVYSIENGNGVFSVDGSLPAGTTATPGDRNITVSGTAANVQTASTSIRFLPDAGSLGKITYKVVLTNAEATIAAVRCEFIPINLVIPENQAACAKLVIASSTNSGATKIKVTFNDTTKDLTNGFVPFNTSINQTAIDIVNNIAANVAAKNALGAENAAWLPLFTATATGAEINVCAPLAGGAEFNGIKLTTEDTGGFNWDLLNSIFEFLGGATKNLNDWLSKNIPAWDKISDVLYGIAGNVLGAVLANAIMNNAGSLQITIPELDPDAKLAFLVRGTRVRVPAGYDADARIGLPTYAAWNSGGRNWTTTWTDNPVWNLYDYLTNKVYGLGNDLNFTSTQESLLLQDLFSISEYCDELVLDEDGVLEKRYSLNTAITDGTRLQILEQLCSVFRGFFVFHFGGLRLSCDRETTTVSLLVNQANAGNFEYDLSSSRTFINRVNVTYIEPSNFYKQEVVQATNNIDMKRNGMKSRDLVMFGCTGRSQAIRYANWLLLSEKYNVASVSYRAGDDHFALVPGQIVQFEDSDERGARLAGRIVSQSASAIVLDGPIAAAAGDSFSVTMQNGVIHETAIASISGTNVTLAVAPPTACLESAVFIASTAGNGKQYYKVIAVDENSTSQYNIKLQVYRTEKFATV